MKLEEVLAPWFHSTELSCLWAELATAAVFTCADVVAR